MVEGVIDGIWGSKLFFHLGKINGVAKSFKFICIKNIHCWVVHVFEKGFCIFLELFKM